MRQENSLAIVTNPMEKDICMKYSFVNIIVEKKGQGNIIYSVFFILFTDMRIMGQKSAICGTGWNRSLYNEYID